MDFSDAALDERKLRMEVEAEMERLKRKHARLESAWEQGKQKTVKYKRWLREGRRMPNLLAFSFFSSFFSSAISSFWLRQIDTIFFVLIRATYPPCR